MGEIMRKWFLTVALLALVAGTAWSAPLEKPAVNRNIKFPTVSVSPFDGRATLIEEGFEASVPPAGWTIMTTGVDYTWDQTTSAANSGEASAVVYYGAPGNFQDEWLVTPALDASSYSSLTLEFAEAESYWASYGLYHNIMVSTTVADDPGAFTAVATYTPSNHTIESWQMTEVDLSAYAGMSNIYVAFRYQGDWADDWYIDDVRIFEPYEHDVKLVSLSPADATVYPGTEFTPQIEVKNIGQNTESFDVNLTVSHDGMVIADETMTVTDLAVGATTLVDFSAFTTAVGNYVLTGATLLATDMDPANDTGAGMVTCWDQPRTPFSILYTEWGCGPCVAANVALDAWYPAQGNDASLMRVHVWWPAGNDPMYWANPDQIGYLHGMTPTVVNGVPTLYMENILDVWTLDFNTWDDGIAQAYAFSAAQPSPLGVELGYNQETGEVQVMVNMVNDLPDGDYRLFVAITEDGVENLGPNGEPIHNQCFRWLFPGVEGISLDTAPGMNVYDVPVTLDPEWVFENLRAVAWVQDIPGGMVLNSGTVFLTEGVVSIDNDYVNDDVDQNDTPALVTRVAGAHPNPFNPMTTVKFSVARTQHVTLAVYNMTGQRVATLVDGTFEAGEHPVQWNGTDASGRGVASGTYIVHMQSEDGVSASKIMLVR
jgi:hypothetical protein